jgi:predicted Zn-dependent protease with MMP-like domain
MLESDHATMIIPPSLDDVEQLARDALVALPERLRQFTKDLVIHVADLPEEDVVAEMELESPFELLGLYQGIALSEKTVEASGTMPDMVFLYRRPILDYWCDSGEDLGHVVRHVLIHEIGHHFGFSDDDMEALEAEAEADERAAKH